MFTVDTSTGLLEQAEFHASPNFNDRPADMPVDMVVVHGISLPAGEFGGEWVDALFLNRIQGNEHPGFVDLKGLKVSTHLFVRRTGQIIQYVPFHKRAWHAGVSGFDGRENCNDYSVGIELEGTDEIPYEPAQYDQLGEAIRALMEAYPAITHERVVGHSDIAPGRKTDPGEVFDWPRLRQLIA